MSTTLALASLRGPVPLAKAFSALDILSGGRVIARVGPGSSKADYEAVGVPFEQRWQRFDEAARLLKALLQPRAAANSGTCYSAPLAGLSRRRGNAAASRCGSEAGALKPACAASPVLAMAGLPPHTTPRQRPSPRP